MKGAGEPGKSEVLGWMARLGRTAADAADHFWPNVEGAERTRVVARIRKWAQLARDAGDPSAPPAATPSSNRPDQGDGDMPTRPDPDYDTARLGRVDFLERQLAELLADLAWVRAGGLVGRVASLDARVSDVRNQLDAARQEGGRVVTLDRSPAAVADEVERRAKRIRELAARASEREL